MHTFVVVQTKPGRMLPPAVLNLLNDPKASDVPFVADDHVHWQDPTGRLHFAGWQVGADQLGVGSRWEVRPGGVTAFTGHVWLGPNPWDQGRSWAAQMADELERRGLAERANDIEGVGAVVSLSGNGSGVVTADPLGVGMVYVADTPDLTVIGSRAALVARAAAGGADPRPDVTGSGWLAFSHCVQTDLTTFENVRALPQGSTFELSPTKPGTTRTWAAMPWLDGSVLDTSAATDAAIDASVAHLRAVLRTHLSVPSWQTTFELTGGRDSRVILALLLAEGAAQDVQCITWGAPTLPDVLLATELVEHFDLAHKASSGRRTPSRPRGATPGASPAPGSGPGPGQALRPPPEPMGLIEKYRHQVWLTSGALSIWDPVRNPDQETSPSVSLTGLFGEILRTDYPRTNDLRTSADLAEFVRTGQFGFDAAGVLTSEARHHYEETLIELIESKRPPGGDVRDAVDGFYQSERMRRWCGTNRENDARNRLFPLYSMTTFRTAFGLGSDRRRAQYLPFEIVRRCNDDLARFGFVNGGWPAELADLVGGDGRYPFDEPTAAPKPLERMRRRANKGRRPNRLKKESTAPPRTAVAAARVKESEEKIDLFRNLVDLSPDHRFFDLVDRKELHQAITDLPRLTFPALKSVHDAVTVAMWLSGDAARARPQGR